MVSIPVKLYGGPRQGCCATRGSWGSGRQGGQGGAPGGWCADSVEPI